MKWSLKTQFGYARLQFVWLLLRTGGMRSLWHRMRLKWAPRLSGNIRAKRCETIKRRPPPATGPLRESTPKGKLSDVVVYTAIFGEYDQLLPISCPDVPHVCFTDNQDLWAEGWAFSYASCSDPILTSRRYKILSQRWFPQYKYSIWIDGNLQLTVDPGELVDSYLSGVDLATFIHPERRCPYKEAEFINHLGLDDPNVVNRQTKRYRTDGFPKNQGLLETAIVIRRHTPLIEKFNELWWREVAGGSRRDQLAIMYAIWKTQCQFNVIPGGREFSPIVNYRAHIRARSFTVA